MDGKGCVVHQGLIVVAKDEASTQNLFYADSDDLGNDLDEFNTLAFPLEFKVPVFKLSCGEHFTVILSNTGKVWAYGKNDWGQLGINEQTAVVAVHPTQVGAGISKVFIKDIACGTEAVVAVSDQGQAFVWGRKMGVYAGQPFSP